MYMPLNVKCCKDHSKGCFIMRVISRLHCCAAFPILFVISFGLFSTTKASETEKVEVKCSRNKFKEVHCTCSDSSVMELLVDPKSKTCEHYFECHLGVARKKMCPRYWAFHPDERKCLPDIQIPHFLCQPGTYIQ